MKHITRYHRKVKYLRYKTAALTLVAALFFMPSTGDRKKTTDIADESGNVFEVMVDGQSVGRLRDRDTAYELFSAARKEIASESGFFLSDADLYIEGR